MLAFVVVTSLTAISLLAGAQQRKPAAGRRRAREEAAGEARPEASRSSPDADDAGALATKDERPPPPASTKDAGAGAGTVESKTLDGGTRVFRFGEVEVEGRLKSPQIVYFLRRVRAEFAAGDLGHRSFVRRAQGDAKRAWLLMSRGAGCARGFRVARSSAPRASRARTSRTRTRLRTRTRAPTRCSSCGRARAARRASRSARSISR